MRRSLWLMPILLATEVACYPSRDRDSWPTLTSVAEIHGPSADAVTVVPHAAAGAVSAARDATEANPARPPLTHVAQVRSLSAEEAAREYPVRVRGVVTTFRPPLLFVQDETEGISVSTSTPLDLDLEPGQLVEIEGVTGPGRFAPIIDRARIRVLGRRPLPAPRRTTLAHLFAGETDAQRVEVDGLMVRHIEGDRLLVVSGADQLGVWLPPAEMEPPPVHLLNARVRIRGVPNTYVNQKRQLVGVALNVSSLADVEVTEPAPDPLSLKVTNIDSVLRFAPRNGMEQLVRVQGTVLLGRADRTFYLQDDTGAAQIQAVEDVVSPQAGDRVDVMGLPRTDGYAPVLQGALVRTTGHGPLPPARRIDVAAALSGEHDLEWVELSGRLLDVTKSGADQVLTLESSHQVFTAYLEHPEPVALSRGSLVKLTGVVSLQLDERPRPDSTRPVLGFRVFLRAPTDIVVLERPLWFGMRHLAALAALAAVLGLAGFLAHRARTIRIKAGFAAVAGERTRMAREIHDTLQQRFVGVLLQLDPAILRQAGLPEGARAPVDRARGIVQSCMAETRRLVQDLRSPALDRHDLTSALEGVVGQLSVGTGAQIELNVVGTPRPLPETVENHLLRIGQEALVNAIRHGQATRVDIELTFGGGAVSLGVRDDGCGFDSEQPPPLGHFGVMGMRERAQQLGGQLYLHSRPGMGTELRVAVPLES
jgi:signal transduction histidine kinase